VGFGVGEEIGGELARAEREGDAGVARGDEQA
jgi:hypothetical protein